MREEIRAYRGV